MPDPSQTPATPEWPSWLAGLPPSIQVREVVCALAAEYRDDPNEEHRLLATEAEPLLLRLLRETHLAYADGSREALRSDLNVFLNGLGGSGWIAPGSPERAAQDRLRAFAAGGEPAVTGPAERPWRRGADGRWPDGHQCPGCKGPVSEQCDCCAEACDCAVPSAEQAQNALMKAALTRLAQYEPMTLADADGEPRNRSAELNARLAYAAGALEAIARLGEEAGSVRESRNEVRVAAEPGSNARHGDDAPGAVMGMLESAWTLIRDRTGYPDVPPEWETAAEAWRVRYAALVTEHAGKAEPAAEPEPEPAPPLPPGDYGRMELPGMRSHTGWWTEGYMAGQAVMVCRDREGSVVARYIPGPACRFVDLPVPAARTAAADRPALGWSGDDDDQDDYATHAETCRDPDCDGDCMERAPF